VLLASSSLFAPAAAAPAAAQTIGVPVPTQELYPRLSTAVMLNGQPSYPIRTTITKAGLEAVADRLLVQFTSRMTDADLATIQSKANALGAGAAKALTLVGPMSYLVDVTGATSLEAAAAAYKAADSRVVGAGADGLVTVDDATPPNDPSFSSQTNLARVQTQAAWNRVHASSGKWIAIIDTGIDTTNLDMAGGQVVTNVNMFSANETSADVIGHGTHVAGIASAITNNSSEVAGASFGSQLLNIKVFNDATGKAPTDAIVRGIYFASDHFASVINMSLGVQHDCDTNIFGEIWGTDNAQMRDALDYAWSKNVFIVASAGNNSNNAVTFPGSCPHVMSVANTENDDTLHSTSTFGTWVQLAAPGTSVLSTAHAGGTACQSGLSNDTARCTGTSMAAPLVSATAAMVQTSCPSPLTNQAVFDRIANSADPIAGTGTLFQHGRLNALKAVCYPPPTNLHIGTVGMDNLQLLWNDTTPGESFFEVQWELTGSNNWQTLGLFAPNTTSVTHTGLLSGTSYDHRVRACDSNGCSAFSNIATANAGWMRLIVSFSGGGKVTSSPAGINCGPINSACSMLLPPGSIITLTPTASGSVQKGIINLFDHWDGACTGAGYQCTLQLNSNLSAKAVFVKDTP